ncbi:hypothetical protein EYF80_035153 [Liparis tanakae]|uniref:Uncharacterized protein n=1 Tax=Liparis tanakae TaxID=230148 RepID=A0A4Z2GN47_9TELE|nr:hypothetical protein EYF80_035153 [Liparis tanakae]
MSSPVYSRAGSHLQVRVLSPAPAPPLPAAILITRGSSSERAGRIKGPGADLRPLSVRQPRLHLTSLWRPARPTGISRYTEAVPCGDISVPSTSPSVSSSTWDNITGESGREGPVGASPQPVRDPPQRELSPLSGCPAATSYLTAAFTWPGRLPAPLRWERLGVEGIRTESGSQLLTWGR